MMETVNQAEGSYAFVAMFENGTLSCARLDEPLVIGISDNTYYASSDVLGFCNTQIRQCFWIIGTWQ